MFTQEDYALFMKVIQIAYRDDAITDSEADALERWVDILWEDES